jgi:hypothetical protein
MHNSVYSNKFRIVNKHLSPKDIQSRYGNYFQKNLPKK